MRPRCEIWPIAASSRKVTGTEGRRGRKSPGIVCALIVSALKEPPMSVSRKGFVAGTAATLASVGIITPARAADFELKYGHDLPIDHPVNVRSVEAFARIKKATNGRVNFKSFPTSQLGSDPNMIAQLRTGAIESLAMPGAFLNQIAPLASIENLAYAYPNHETVFRAMDGDLGKVVRDDIQTRGGMVVL